MSQPAHDCPRCGRRIIRPQPGAVSFYTLATQLTDAGTLVLVCANRQCRTRLVLAVDGPRRYRLVLEQPTFARAS